MKASTPPGKSRRDIETMLMAKPIFLFLAICLAGCARPPSIEVKHMCEVLHSFTRESGEMLARWAPAAAAEPHVLGTHLVSSWVTRGIGYILLVSGMEDSESSANEVRMLEKNQEIHFPFTNDRTIDSDAIKALFASILNPNCPPGGDAP
jgi:hypothetical protein